MPMQFFEPRYEPPDLRDGFAAADIPYAGAAAFDCLFRIVAVASTRPIDVRCRNCRHLSPDEALLLQMTGALQRRDEEEARQALAQWLPPAAIRTALEPLHILAHTMRMAGLRLPQSPLPAMGAAAIAMHHTCAETVH